MSATTGPVLATGAITMFNETILNGKGIDWRVPLATGLAAMGFSLFERAAPKLADVLAWTMLITVLFSRTDPTTPSPTENLLAWWDKTQGGSTK
jgi:Na+-translocating ferredoxin:NAD+ oxidoreductase RnfD subunit